MLCETHFRGTFRAFCERTRANHKVVVIMGQGPGIIMGDGSHGLESAIDAPSAKHVWTRISHSLRETHFRAPFTAMLWVHVDTQIVMVHGYDGP